MDENLKKLVTGFIVGILLASILGWLLDYNFLDDFKGFLLFGSVGAFAFFQAK